MSGKVGDLSPAQEEKLKQFREAVSDVLSPNHDDYFLLRWLRARKFDVGAAEVMLRKSLEWRKVHKIDNLLEYEFPEAIQKYVSGGIVGNSKDGSPVWIFPHACIDFKGLVRSAKRTDLVKLSASHLEKSEVNMKQQSEKLGKRVEEIIFIHDLENISLSTYIWKPVLETGIEIFKMLDANYPEKLKKLYAINCPKFIPFLFSILRPFMSEEVVKKTAFYSSEGWKEVLLEEIDASELPQHWGGTKVDPDGDPKCPSVLFYADGPVPPSYNMNWNEYLSKKKNTKSAEIDKKSFLPVEISIKQYGCIAKWEFVTENYDIAFGVFRRKEKEGTSRKGKGDMEEIVPLRRVNSHIVLEEGAALCDVPGTYVFKFDNSFSWIHCKKLLYNIEIVPPETTRRSEIESGS